MSEPILIQNRVTGEVRIVEIHTDEEFDQQNIDAGLDPMDDYE